MNKINLLSVNWLVLKINNKSFERYHHLIRGRVIDLGCGTSPYKDDILKIADELVGVDWRNSQHDQSNVDVFADLTKKLPFEENHADTVVSFQVMEHIPEPAFFLSECFRILRPGGRLLITVPFMWHVHEEPHDYFRYTRYGLEHLLRKNNFTDIMIEENTGFWQMWVLKFNYHTARFARPVKYLFLPVWLIGQIVAPILDRFNEHPEETASYTVTARKP